MGSRTFSLKRGKSLYEVLEVPSDATADQIRLAYKRLAFKYHPDRNPNDSVAAEKFKQLNKAHSVLSDENKKKLYDEYGDVGVIVGSKLGTDKTAKTVTKVKSNPCCLCCFLLASLLTCCCCCAFCCCCCGKLEIAGDDCNTVELSDLNEENQQKDVVESQPTIKAASL